MGSDDFIELDPPGVSSGVEDDGPNDANSSFGEPVLQDAAPEIQSGIPNTELEIVGTPNGELKHSEVGCRSEDEEQQTVDDDGNVTSSQNQTNILENVELTTTITVMNEITEVKSGPISENGNIIELNENAVSSDKMHGHYTSGIKRARNTCDEQQPSVRVIYNSLTRDSKRKLEELLQQWSEWHAQNVSSSDEPAKEGLETGEETFFPALNIGKEKSSTVLSSSGLADKHFDTALRSSSDKLLPTHSPTYPHNKSI